MVVYMYEYDAPVLLCACMLIAPDGHYWLMSNKTPRPPPAVGPWDSSILRSLIMASRDGEGGGEGGVGGGCRSPVRLGRIPVCDSHVLSGFDHIDRRRWYDRSNFRAAFRFCCSSLLASGWGISSTHSERNRMFRYTYIYIYIYKMKELSVRMNPLFVA